MISALSGIGSATSTAGVAATGFELVVPSDVPTSREPTDSELAIIDELDPKNTRGKEVPS